MSPAAPARTGKFPDFLIVGAQKCGTTWLYGHLQAAPQIWLSPIKEIHFFDEKLFSTAPPNSRDQGNDPWETERWHNHRRQFENRQLSGEAWDQWAQRYFYGEYGYDWYRSLFPVDPGLVVGESTPNYADLSADIIHQIRDENPRLKIVYGIRNPIDRLWSYALMWARVRGDGTKDVEQLAYETLHAVQQGNAPAEFHDALIFCDYLAILRQWAAFFPPSQVFVVFLEDIRKRPAATLQALGGFLGVECPDLPDQRLRKSVNASSSDSISTAAARLSQQMVGNLIDEQAQMLGGHATGWPLAARMIAEADSDRLPFPLSRLAGDDRLRSMESRRLSEMPGWAHD